MHFWRDENFKALSEAAKLASANPAWSEYGAYCDLLVKGLRKNALSQLELFIETASKWSLDKRKEFASWLYHYENQNPAMGQLLPHPLIVNLLEPTLVEWIVCEPECGEPHRWLYTPDHLRDAIRLDPDDEIARARLINWITSGVSHSMNHLTCCNRYTGNPTEDLQALEEVESIIELVADEKERSNYRNEVVELRNEIYAYLNGETKT